MLNQHRLNRNEAIKNKYNTLHSLNPLNPFYVLKNAQKDIDLNNDIFFKLCKNSDKRNAEQLFF